MEQVMIIPRHEWEANQERLKEMEKRLARVEKGQTESLGNAEAIKMTGLSLSTLVRYRKEGRLTDVGHGKKVLYLRSEINQLIEDKIPPYKLKRA